MEHYNLKEDEVVLYKGEISMKNGNTQLILTNLNVVFITIHKRLFGEAIVESNVFPVEDIKIFDGIPQVKSKNLNVEMYFKTAEIEFSFESKSELHKFVSATNELLTGKTGAERNAEKVKDAIDLVNDTLGIDIVKSAGELVKSGVPGKIAGAFGKLGTVFGKKKK